MRRKKLRDVDVDAVGVPAWCLGRFGLRRYQSFPSIWRTMAAMAWLSMPFCRGLNGREVRMEEVLNCRFPRKSVNGYGLGVEPRRSLTRKRDYFRFAPSFYVCCPW
jgi:hypothetical protein